MKHAFVFPGQGSQSLGMLAELASEYGVVKATFEALKQLRSEAEYKALRGIEDDAAPAAVAEAGA